MFLDVKDEFAGNPKSFGRLDFAGQRITVRELIHERVREEMDRLGEQRKVGSSQVAPTGAEARLNASRVLTTSKTSSRAVQLETAERAFQRNEYFVLLDDRQAVDLDEVIDLDATSNATFLLLTPLQGG